MPAGGGSHLTRICMYLRNSTTERRLATTGSAKPGLQIAVYVFYLPKFDHIQGGGMVVSLRKFPTLPLKRP